MTESTATLPASLESIVGAAYVSAGPETLAQYSTDEISPSVVARPANAEEAAAVVRLAASENFSLIPSGTRTKLAIGAPPSRYHIAMDMTRLNQIAHYDAGDLTLSVDAGMPLAKLNAVLLQRHQFLPLLVPYYSLATIGGAIASGIDSPLRHLYGTARDFLIGAEFIDGTGALCKSGGRVVKNVTGYDLHKLLIGSLGSLVVITRLNFRTFPRPISSRGFVASFPALDAALALRKKIAASPLNLLTLDVVDPALAHIFATRYPSTPEVPIFFNENSSPAGNRLPLPGDWFHPAEFQVCAAFAGTPEVLDRCARDLHDLAAAADAASAVVLDDSTRPSLWGRLRESLAMLRDASPHAVVFKLGALPEQHGALLSRLTTACIAANVPSASVARATGSLYFALLPAPESTNAALQLPRVSSRIFGAASALGGHAQILFAPPSLKRQVSVWNSPRQDSALMRQVKRAFDPQNLFAPGRFLPGV